MSKVVKIGKVLIGGGNKIAVQTMTTFKPRQIDETLLQINDAVNAGCDIIRTSVNSDEDIVALNSIKKRINIPIVADIHFDYRLAIKAIDAGVDKIRINPGNIGSDICVKAVADAVKANNVAVRVGANTGSIEKEFLAKYGRSEISLVESALKNVSILEKHGVENIVVSVKASDVRLNVKAYEYLSTKTDYPLHLGVTEAGVYSQGIVKNSIGIGSLLLKGIGDTIRVSLSDSVTEEVLAGRNILRALNLEEDFVDVIACPTCGRCEWDCMSFANEVYDLVKGERKKLKIAVMGCVVNGPGEASDADLGIAGGKDKAVIFKNGNVIKTVDILDAKKEFIKEIKICLQ